mmetsp:Transcript_34097/g.62765  ORF Transcript_34097/g.62765 Transcript_34097/m.62765 type:complete len:637 (-) Transcript_34097:156-2066(-)
MTKNDDAVEEKLCGACLQSLSKELFSKKQWQQKQRRRCKDCADSGKEIDVDGLTAILNDNDVAPPSSPSSSNRGSGGGGATTSKQKKGKQKNQPIFAGNTDGQYQPNVTGNIYGLKAKLAYDVCAWCGKAEESKELMMCSICKNIYYCSSTCQKAAYPEHRLVCDQMKQDWKSSKQERKARKKDDFSMSEASGTGSFFLEYHPGPNGISFLVFSGELRGEEQPGQHFASKAAEEGMRKILKEKFPLFCRRMEEESMKSMGTLKRTEMFTSVDELYAIDQFLLSCGPLDDIQRAKEAIPYVLHQIHISGLKPDGSIPNIGDITVRGYGLNALEWASRRGNFAIAKWLATDSRTKVMLTRADSAPVAWACYTNRVELAKMLVKHGADSHATTPRVFDHKPPSHLASENGQLLALKFLIEKCGHDIHECDTVGQDIRVSLRRNNKVWAQSAGCVACDDYAKSKGVLGEMSTTNKKAKAAAKNKTHQQTSDAKKLEAALRQLSIAGGREDEPDSEDEEEEGDNPTDYLNELLSVADARYDLGQYSKAASLYYRGYYAAMHSGSGMNNPAIFPIAHKMTQAWVKTGEKSDLSMAHGMAQQNVMMPGHPAYIRKDLAEVERIMAKKGMNVERFGTGMGGFGF